MARWIKTGNRRGLLRDCGGAAGVEYALAVTFVVLTIIGALANLGGGVERNMNGVEKAIPADVKFSTRG